MSNSTGRAGTWVWAKRILSTLFVPPNDPPASTYFWHMSSFQELLLCLVKVCFFNGCFVNKKSHKVCFILQTAGGKASLFFFFLLPHFPFLPPNPPPPSNASITPSFFCFFAVFFSDVFAFTASEHSLIPSGHNREGGAVRKSISICAN